ncbi:TadE/TadG family type IV pilus assembly protein [Thalassoglobus polymorphus]|uniref:TadE-like protein n=1 Tax=Thalassoglobus polymorphus TaxID=2527994 RepID=A0A517QRB1_9PLAN|nr:TadE family protein [Thalassoglobus polymorphus]QDT34170.1 TadE-like protein [Thalassoglobus polymorphus]
MLSNQTAKTNRFVDAKNGVGREGTAATELAIMLPVLLTFLLGCVDYGRVTYWAISVSNANATGCFYGATHRLSSLNSDAWEEKIQLLIAEELSENHGFEPDNLSSEIETELDANEILLVTVRTSYAFRTIVNWPGLPHEVALSESVTFRQFR